MFKFRSLVALLIVLILAACTSAEPAEEAVAVVEPAEEAATAGDEEMGGAGEMEAEHEEMAGEEAATGRMGDEEMDSEEMTGEENVAPASERPAWQQISLTNARTGESFTFADLAGKTVFVEPMATWCTNCRQQLMNVSQAQAEIGASEDVVFVALSVETSLAPEQLAQYADSAGFDWHFAVMSPEMLERLVEAFGRSIANPPATPHFVIRADGSTTELVTGIEAASQIVAQIEAARG